MASAVKKVANAEIRAAKKFLQRRKIETDEISPKDFARLAGKLDKSFNQTLKILARELTAGQV
jgi:hypothetical protein|tara:strand:- start:182 stop:370 length:189 start_codon:yes stop_codon:yes gene_type:complete